MTGKRTQEYTIKCFIFYFWVYDIVFMGLHQLDTTKLPPNVNNNCVFYIYSEKSYYFYNPHEDIQFYIIVTT
jgi:hypothetical protein